MSLTTHTTFNALLLLIWHATDMNSAQSQDSKSIISLFIVQIFEEKGFAG